MLYIQASGDLFLSVCLNVPDKQLIIYRCSKWGIFIPREDKETKRISNAIKWEFTVFNPFLRIRRIKQPFLCL